MVRLTAHSFECSLRAMLLTRLVPVKKPGRMPDNPRHQGRHGGNSETQISFHILAKCPRQASNFLREMIDASYRSLGSFGCCLQQSDLWTSKFSNALSKFSFWSFQVHSKRHQTMKSTLLQKLHNACRHPIVVTLGADHHRHAVHHLSIHSHDDRVSLLRRFSLHKGKVQLHSRRSLALSRNFSMRSILSSCHHARTTPSSVGQMVRLMRNPLSLCR